MTESILIIGAAGSVGHDMLYQIASMGLPIKVIGADIDEEKGKFEVEESLHVAHNFGYYPDITFQKINLFDIGETSELLKEMQGMIEHRKGSMVHSSAFCYYARQTVSTTTTIRSTAGGSGCRFWLYDV